MDGDEDTGISPENDIDSGRGAGRLVFAQVKTLPLLWEHSLVFHEGELQFWVNDSLGGRDLSQIRSLVERFLCCPLSEDLRHVHNGLLVHRLRKVVKPADKHIRQRSVPWVPQYHPHCIQNLSNMHVISLRKPFHLFHFVRISFPFPLPFIVLEPNLKLILEIDFLFTPPRTQVFSV